MNVKKSRKENPPVNLAIFALNTIYNTSEPWIHIKIRTFLSFYNNHPSGLKFNVSIINPSSVELPPIKILVAVRPVEFGPDGCDKVSSFVHEQVYIDRLAASAIIHKEIDFNNHFLSLKVPLFVTVQCSPIFDCNENDWQFPPLYNTVITSLDLLLKDDESQQIRRNNPKLHFISMGSKPTVTSFSISAFMALQLAMKEFPDITEGDILASLFHYKNLKLDNSIKGFILTDKELIEIEVKVKKVLPPNSNNAFQIHIHTGDTVGASRLLMELQKKLKEIIEFDSFARHKPSRPSSIIWNPVPPPSQSYDIVYESE